MELEIKSLRPNNWFLSQDKVAITRLIWKKRHEGILKPVVVTKIDGDWALIDGHSRAFVAWENGRRSISVEIVDFEELGEFGFLYRWIHKHSAKEGVNSIPELGKHILPSKEYKDLWVEFCRLKFKQLLGEQSTLLEEPPT